MKWFYKLKNGVRVIIAAASWLPLIVFAGVIGGTVGDSGENLQAWQAVIVLAFLALGVLFTVLAVKARRRERQAERESKTRAAVPSPQPQHDTSAPARPSVPVKRAASISFNVISGKEIKTVTDATAAFSDVPDFTAKLMRNGSAAYQDNITSCNVGDNVLLEYDYDKDGILCISSGGEVGYLPDRAIENRRGKYLLKISEMPYNENTDKYGVVVSAYALKADGRGVSFPVNTKIRGVTYEGRQAWLSESKAGDVLTIRHAPTTDYPNTVAVVNERTGKTLGNIGSDLADALLGAYGEGCVFNGEIIEITGGTSDQNYGCNIIIDGAASRL